MQSRHDGGFRILSEEEIMERLRRIALLCAKWHGVPEAEQEDCVQEFIEILFVRHREALKAEWEGDHFNAWARKCAVHHVQNFRRHQARQRAQEVAWTEISAHTDASVSSGGDSASLSERSLCRQEARRFLEQALARLKPATRELLWRHYGLEERLSELAAAQGKTPDAARMQVQRGLERLRSILEERGLDWDEIKTYLSDFDSTSPPRNRSSFIASKKRVE